MTDLQIISSIFGGVVTIFIAGFGMVKYKIGHDGKRDRLLFEYLTTKNGHNERISKEFSETVRLMTRALDANTNRLEEVARKPKRKRK